MREVTLLEAKQDLDQLLDDVKTAPVTIIRGDERAAIVVSASNYARLQAFARLHALDTMRALQEEAAANGLSEEILEALLADES